MVRRIALCLLLGLALTGCITAANTLSVEQLASFRLQAVDVTVAPNAMILWDEPGLAVAQARNPRIAPASARAGRAGEPSPAAGLADGQALARRTAAELLRKALIAEVGPELNGARPVRLAVRIHELEISSAIQRIIIGGDHRIVADVDLLDARSGAPLLTLPAHMVLVKGGGGLVGVALDNIIRADPIQLVTAAYAREYRNWLLRK
jgi:hypothetical protein